MKPEESKIETQKQPLDTLTISNSADHKVWDELFGILAWKFKPTKSGDMYLDAEAVFNELKNKFDLKRK